MADRATALAKAVEEDAQQWRDVAEEIEALSRRLPGYDRQRWLTRAKACRDRAQHLEDMILGFHDQPRTGRRSAA